MTLWYREHASLDLPCQGLVYFHIAPLCPLWLLWPSLHLCCFFVVVTAHAKYDPLAQFVFSPRLFSCPPVPLHHKAPIKPPCAPIRGHSCIFFLFLTKHDVRGNFPGHGPMILVCETLNDPYLPCFCVRHASCGPMHPCAPIRAHLHLFLTVYTPCIHVYMYNLIEI